VVPNAATVTGVAEPERTRMILVTFGLLQAMDVPPLLGRWLSLEDDTPGAPEVVLLSYGYWQRRFGGDQGCRWPRASQFDSRPRRIIGVMPPSFFTFMGQNPGSLHPVAARSESTSLRGLGFSGNRPAQARFSLAEANSDVAPDAPHMAPKLAPRRILPSPRRLRMRALPQRSGR